MGYKNNAGKGEKRMNTLMYNLITIIIALAIFLTLNFFIRILVKEYYEYINRKKSQSVNEQTKCRNTCLCFF